MVFLLAPTILCLVSTIVLDILNHISAIGITIEDTNTGVTVTEEDRKRRERLPKRATLINTCLFVPWLAYSAIFGNITNMDLETRVLWVTVPNALVSTLRNPIFATWAVKVNQQIRLETVEDRRKKEIEDAMRKKAERTKRRIADTNNVALDGSGDETPNTIGDMSLQLKPIGR